MSALIAESLWIGQGGFRAGPISLAVAPGETMALIGANGGGKSTLLRTLGGLLPPLSGILHVAGTAALLPPPGVLSVPFSAAHMVALGRAAHRPFAPVLGVADRAAAAAALAQMGIPALADRAFDRLSSGQRQLVLLARLLAQDAPLCLLDEPTATLDPAQAARVERCMAALAAAGRTLVVATHDLALAGRADQVLAVGADNAFGPPAAVLTPARLAALYGSEIGNCPTCGHADAATI